MIAMFERLFGTGRLSPVGATFATSPSSSRSTRSRTSPIALAYLVIPAAIWTFVSRRRDLPPQRPAGGAVLVIFMVSGGLAHLAQRG